MLFNVIIYRKDNFVVSVDKSLLKKDKYVIYWVRKDLCLYDNLFFLEVVKGSDIVRVIYVLDMKVDS